LFTRGSQDREIERSRQKSSYFNTSLQKKTRGKIDSLIVEGLLQPVSGQPPVEIQALIFSLISNNSNVLSLLADILYV